MSSYMALSCSFDALSGGASASSSASGVLDVALIGSCGAPIHLSSVLLERACGSTDGTRYGAIC